MKTPKRPQPTRSKLSLFRQLCHLIPNHLVPKLAREHGVAARARSFSPWSQVVALLYAQFTHAVGLNDVCDSLRLHSGPLSAVRGATPPSRNGFSHANRHRDPALAEDLFWQMLEHLKSLCPAFAGGAGRRLARRFTRSIHVVDSTVLELIASCLDWARHRRRKAAAKCHVRLDLQSFLPRFVLFDSARHADGYHARAVCAGLRAGEIVLFDRAYVDFAHLLDLTRRGVFWVTRAKESHQFRVVKKLLRRPEGKILRDDLAVLKVPATRASHPARLRRVVRAGLWLKLDLRALLESYGTAGGRCRLRGRPEAAYLPGFG